MNAPAPNVYWALTVIPRPLIDLHKGNEFEQAMVELQFPDLADLSRPRSPEQWDTALRRVRKETERIIGFDLDGEGKSKKVLKPGTTWKDPASKSPELPAARKYLTEVVGMSAASVEAMPPAQVLLLYFSKYYHELRDDVFKTTYLPFPTGRRLGAEAELRLKSQPDTEASRLTMFLPAVLKVNLAQARIERKLAACGRSKRCGCTPPLTAANSPTSWIRSRSCRRRMIQARHSRSSIRARVEPPR